MLTSETRFITLIKSLKPEDWNKKATEKWSVKDVVAHMVGWEREDSDVIRLTWENKERPWFMKTEDYNEFNKKWVEYYRNYTSQELIQELETWQKTVQAEIDSIGEENLKTRLDLFKWLFNDGEDNHYNHHYRQIMAATE